LTLYRLIAPDWLMELEPTTRRVLEGRFSPKQLKEYNAKGYNCYYLPNYPSQYQMGTTADGSQIDTFNFCFVDFDLKSGGYPSKEAFIAAVGDINIPPTRIVDSGGGVHVYWAVTDLDAKSYLRLTRRLMRLLKTDEAVGQIFQLMRAPDTLNTKLKDNPRPCEVLFETDTKYTCEELDRLLPALTSADEQYCQQHYDKTYRTYAINTNVNDTLPAKFGKLLRNNAEAKAIWANPSEDRSKDDYRLGHLMYANDFTKDEAMSVLVNSAKALNRAPIHRVTYAENITDKIWTYEEAGPKAATNLSESVLDILSRGDQEYLKGQRFPCYEFFDGSEGGFRLTQVLGLCAGVGVGKTAIALNIFKGFVEHNPDYVHMFVSLEQPGREIAHRWSKMCGKNTNLHSKVHILSNYNEDGSYRNLSLAEIQTYVLQFQKDTGLKLGCICIDHIGVLKQKDASGEHQGLREVCAQMKSFAVVTQTLLIMQSQTNREKAGIGDLELHKDAAYGTQNFESYVDYMLVAWQPLKRCYDNPACPRVTAYKYAKVRAKSKGDRLIEDQCYRLIFDQDTETLRPITQDERDSFNYFANQALALRKKDRKTDLVTYQSTDVPEVPIVVKSDSDRQSTRH